MKNLASIFKKSRSQDAGPLFGFGTSAQADWKIIFFSTLVFILIVSILNLALFVQINRGEIFVIEEKDNAPQHTLDLEKLRETNAYYQNKALGFERIKKATSTPITDP